MSGLQILGQDARLGDRSHEIGIASPARKDVDVNVIYDASPCGSPQVHTHIKSGRLVNVAERDLRSLGQIHHLISCRLGRRRQVTYMLVWNNH